MVNEVTPAKGRLSSRAPNEQTRESVPAPEFGKPTAIRAGPATSRVPFNIPKHNQPRVEHHRPPTNRVSSQTDRSGMTNANTSVRNQPFDPFQPVVLSAYSSTQTGYGDAFGISRPSQPLWTTKQAAPPVFSSKASGMTKSSSVSKTLQSFIDLTKGDDDKPATKFGPVSYHREITSADTYSYIDAAKAQENIKALLEGAFEDEEDKPKTRARKKKMEADVNDLTAKLEKVSVAPTDAKDENVADGEEDDDEEEEEKVDDGTREGLKVKLLPHQIEGVAWMCEKENGQKRTRGVLPKGGILADDMGLGKTIQSIALILTNPKPPKQKKTKDGEKTEKENHVSDKVDKSTLIVAPLALIKQWESEIADKIEKSHALRVCVYHGQGRNKLSSSLKDYDVVITTYGTLSSEHAASETGKVGCFGVHWYRIILDEAHMIKNRNAKATQAACALDAQYRWCLTGTPLQNNLDELQSLIKFLRIQPFDELAAFRDQITQPLNNGRGGLAIKRLQIFLKVCMKRRTKDVLKLNGNLKPGDQQDTRSKPSSNGFQIVKREVIKVEADFTQAEVDFYNRLEQRTDRRLSQMMGGSKLDYASALVMLLRLRQACNHPDLVKSDLAEDKDVLLNNVDKNKSAKKDDDLDSVADLFGGLSVVSKKCDICQVDLSAAESKTGTSRCSECADLEIELKPNKLKKKSEKKIKQPKQESIPEAGLISRKERARRNRRVIEDSDEDEEDGEWIVANKERPSTNLGKAGGSEDEDAEGDGEWIGSDDSSDSIEAKKGEVINISSSEEESDDDSYGDDDEEYDGPNIAPSTKVRALIRILRKEAPEYKFIVFSVFTQMLDKIEPFLKRAKLGYARYDGSMRNDLREASLEQLRNRSSTRVLLCSLRAGALGLNLTAASRVVILEPFWNPFVEEQAIDRVHRLNQTVDVKIYKMTIKNTVEERILDLQERKRELASAAIEGKAAAGKLTMRDMMALFGRDAEARFDNERGAPNLTTKTRLLVSKNDDDSHSAGTGDSRSLPSNQSSSQDARRRQDRKPSRPDDSVYGRRW